MPGHLALLLATLHSGLALALWWSRFIQQLHCAIFWLKAEDSLSRSPASLQHTGKGALLCLQEVISGDVRAARLLWCNITCRKEPQAQGSLWGSRGQRSCQTQPWSAKAEVLASRRNNIWANLFSETLRYPYTHLAGCALMNHLSVMSKPSGKLKRKWAQQGPQRWNMLISLVRKIINIHKCMRTHVESCCVLLMWIMNMGNWMFPTHPLLQKKMKIQNCRGIYDLEKRALSGEIIGLNVQAWTWCKKINWQILLFFQQHNL